MTVHSVSSGKTGKPAGKGKIKRIMLILALIAAAGILCLISADITVRTVGGSSITSRGEAVGFENADCILVLGAGVREDGTPSHMLEDRLKEAIELYKAGAAKKILMSGDHGSDDYDEVNTMKKYAVEHGVPSEDVFMDHAGFSTYDSIYRAKYIFGCKKVIIVTQRYHLYRALFLAKSFGIEAAGVPSDPRTYAGQSVREVREVLARAKDLISSVIKPKPKYLGDKISLDQSGDVTNG